MSSETKDILTRLQTGEHAVLEELFQTHYPMVCKSIHRFIKDKSLVEDLAQEVFIRLWQKRNQINVTQSFAAYIRRMAINEALGHIRKSKRYQIEEFDTKRHEGSGNGIEEQYLYGELKSNINQAIDTLPPRCKLIFQLSRFEDMTYKEIAQKLEISIKTVENQMGKALKILREKIKTYF